MPISAYFIKNAVGIAPEPVKLLFVSINFVVIKEYEDEMILLFVKQYSAKLIIGNKAGLDNDAVAMVFQWRQRFAIR